MRWRAPQPAGAAELQIDDHVVSALRERLPEVAAQTVAAVIVEVPGYTGALRGSMGANIEAAVQMALGGFLKLAAAQPGVRPQHPARPDARGCLRARPRRGAQRPLDGRAARRLPGRRPGGLARDVRRRRAGRAARGDDGAVRRAGLRLHRRAVRGQRRRPHRRAVDHRPGPGALPRAARPAAARRRRRRRAGRQRRAGRLAGARDADRGAAARRPGARRGGRAAARAPCRSARTCPGAEGIGDEQLSLLLVPDLHGRDRRHLLRLLARPLARWSARPARGRRRGRRTCGRCGPGGAGRRRSPAGRDAPVDTEEHLAELVVGADPEALADLRARVLAPLAELRPAAADAARRDAAVLAAAPGPSRRRRGGPARAPADGPLPDGPAARAVRRPARRPAHGARARAGAGDRRKPADRSDAEGSPDSVAAGPVTT